MKKKISMGLMLIATFILTVGPMANLGTPASGQDETITIDFWWTEGSAEGALYESLIAEFEEANPGIVVNDEQRDYFATNGDWSTAYTAGTEPDVLRADVTWITTWAYEEKLLVIDPADVTDYEDFTDETIEKVLWNGELYGIPQVADALGMFYNVKYLEEAGVTIPANGFTLDQFKSAGASLNTWAADGGLADIGLNWTADDFYPFNMQGYTYAFLPIMYAHGASYFVDNNITKANINFDTDAWRNALGFLEDILPGGDDEMTPPADEQGWGTIDSYFTTGKVAMIFIGPWATNGYLSSGAMFSSTGFTDVFGGTAPDWVNNDNLGFMKVPSGVAQGIHSGGHAYVISKKSDNPEEALLLADFLAGKKAAYERSKTNHLVSPRESTYTEDFNTSDDYVPADDEITSGFRLNLNTGITRPVHPYWTPLDNLVAPELEQFRNGNRTINEVIDNVVGDFEAYFDVNGELIGGAGDIPEVTRASPGFDFAVVFAGLISSVIALTVIRKRK